MLFVEGGNSINPAVLALKDKPVAPRQRNIVNGRELIGWRCNANDCNWHSGPSELFEVLRDFGAHNRSSHKQDIAVHVVEVRQNTNPTPPRRNV